MIRRLTEAEEERRREQMLRQIRHWTDDFRRSSEPGWQELRRLLRDEGIAPDESALAEFFESDSKVWSGFIVTPTDRTFEFSFDFLSHDERGRAVVRDDPKITLFRKIGSNTKMHLRRDIELGKQFLSTEKGS